MPYYRWRGINISGADCVGRHFARSIERLDVRLFKDEIALLEVYEERLFTNRPLSCMQLASLCEQLADLLEAGLRLSEALDVLASTIRHGQTQAIIEDCSLAVKEGISLSNALGYHQKQIDYLFVVLVNAGEESSALPNALRMLHRHYLSVESLAKRLKGALLVPFITLIGFTAIIIALFVLVIPRFEALFAMFDKPVPAITKTFFWISSILRDSRVLVGFVVLVSLIAAGFRIFGLARYKPKRDKWIISVPLIGPFVRLYSLTLFLEALSVLLLGGVHLVKAFKIARQTVHNVYLQEALDAVTRNVEAGQALSVSFKSNYVLKHVQLDTFFAVGEKTGKLASVTNKAAHVFNQKTNRSLTVFATFLPPIVLVLLGLLIGLLIFAVYTPLLTLSHVIG